MKAVQYRTVGAAPEVVTVPDPEPGPGQVLLKVTAAGVCHSDIAVMSRPRSRFRSRCRSPSATRAWAPSPPSATG